MEILFILTTVVQAVAISLGVGCSTLAILNFFSAIADGTIDATERRMMGVVYVVLRVAMVLILITTGILSVLAYTAIDQLQLTAYAGFLWMLIGILYTNALLMTTHIVPSTIGPALQASAWYSLGIVTALATVGLTGFSFLQFFLAYITLFALAVMLVNGTMWYLKNQKREDLPA